MNSNILGTEIVEIMLAKGANSAGVRNLADQSTLACLIYNDATEVNFPEKTKEELVQKYGIQSEYDIYKNKIMDRVKNNEDMNPQLVKRALKDLIDLSVIDPSAIEKIERLLPKSSDFKGLVDYAHEKNATKALSCLIYNEAASGGIADYIGTKEELALQYGVTKDFQEYNKTKSWTEGVIKTLTRVFSYKNTDSGDVHHSPKAKQNNPHRVR